MKRIKLKNKNLKKKFNYKPLKFLFFIIIVLSSTIFTIKYLIDNSEVVTKDEYINYLLNKSYNKSTNNFFIKESVKLISKIDLSSPNTLLDNNMKNYKEKEEVKEKDAKSNEDNYTQDVYEKVTSYVEKTTEDKENPIIYLYNSHQLETYSNIGFENSNISPNVMMVSYLLSEKLNEKGLNTIVEDTNISEFIKISNMDSDAFYASTRIFIKNAISSHNTLKYFIDLHRDSVGRDISVCTINNKDYARILFVLGTTNPNYGENESIMKKLDSIADEKYPNLSRGIYYRPTPDWPDSYNQDLNGGVILIEVGGKDNTIEEVSNTVNALSDIINDFIKGE